MAPLPLGGRGWGWGERWGEGGSPQRLHHAGADAGRGRRGSGIDGDLGYGDVEKHQFSAILGEPLDAARLAQPNRQSDLGLGRKIDLDDAEAAHLH